MQTATRTPTANELWTQWWTDAGDQFTKAWQPWVDYLQSWGATTTKPRRRHEHDDDDCGCGDICRCCVPDAEIVVRARAGERRVVAFELHNRTHREKEVLVGVGEWMACSGPKVEVRSEFDVAEKLVLGPCESKIVRLLVEIGAGGANDRQGRGDVEACASAYADVRFDGCARPIRVAVVVLPASCDPYDVTCDCGCC
jgi:hypothetical protein